MRLKSLAGRPSGPVRPGPGRFGLSLVLTLVLTLAMVASVLTVTQQPSAAQSSNAIAVGELRVTPTLDHIGVVWFVDGDRDLDSTMRIEFRRAGQSEWLPGAPAMRAEPNVIVDGSPLGINSWAASAMFLERGTAYEIRATVSDPDGGSSTRTVQATTRSLPVPSPRRSFVVPGSGGGNGTEANPFRGLQTAADNASPGDTFEVAAGVYETFVLSTSGRANAPISFVGADGGQVIVDGAGTGRGVITLESTSHVILSGLTIRNGGWGIDAQNTSEIVVSNNVITDVDFGVYNRRDGDRERYQVVCDNVIEGRTSWPGSGIPGERGIDLRGWGNTVCNNTVSSFGDCVSVQPLTGASFGNDVFGNDANRCVDDGIEVDYNQANVRVYRNRVSNSRQGVSVQPIRGGPAYIFRNELFNLENSTLKLNNGPSGLFVAHNTGIKLENALEDGSVFNNTMLRNNLFIGTRYAFEFNTTQATPGSRDFDYNAWGARPAGNAFKWDTTRYETISDLPTGVEDNGIQVDLSAVVAARLPSSFDVEVPPGSQNLQLSAGSPAINVGTDIVNINAPFVTDNAPDLGAFEAGSPQPGYGPGTPLIAPPNGNPPPPPPPPPGQPISIGGQVSDSNAVPTSGVIVDLFAGDAEGRRLSYLTSTRTGGDGDYRFDAADSGCYVVTFIAPQGRVFVDGDLWHQQARCLLPGDADLAVDAQLRAISEQTGGISGSVTTPTGQGVEAMTIDLFLANGDSSRAAYLWSTTTGNDGGYRFEVEPGCYVLVFIAGDGQRFPNGTGYVEHAACVAARQTINFDVTLAP